MKKRFESLDVFRGLAAISVALFHFSKDAKGIFADVPFIANSNRMVDFFFVLSGFIIYHNYKNVTTSQQRGDYLIKRLYRLYPLHFFMMIIFLLFEVLKAVLYSKGFFNTPAFGRNSMPEFFKYIAMLQGLTKEGDLHWNYPSWSISAEFIAYIIFALVIIPINRIKTNLKWLPLLFIAFCALITPMIFSDVWIFGYVIPCIIGFFIGCVVEIMYHKTSVINIPNAFYSILEIVVLCAAIYMVCYLNTKDNAWLFPVYGLMILVFANERGVVSHLSTNTITKWLGRLSFSIYMTHALISIVVTMAFKILHVNESLYIFATIPFLFTVLLFSHFTYKYVEIGGSKLMASLFKNIFNVKVSTKKAPTITADQTI